MLGQFGPRWIDVEAEHAASSRLQQLDGKLTEQSEPDDGDQIAELRFRGSNTVERNRTQGCESGFLKRRFCPDSTSGNLCHQQPGHAGNFRVHGKSRASAGNAVAGLQIGDSLSGRNHGSSAAVPGSLRLVETGSHRLYRRENTVALNLADYLAHEIRTCSCLLHEILAGKLGRCPFRPGGDNGRRNPHQYAAGQKLRRRNFGHGHFTGSRVLENLFHDFFTSPNPRRLDTSEDLRG
jgi:hypothetical protein